MTAKKIISAAALTLMLAAGAASAQTTGTTTGTGTGATTGTVGTPNTGVGGNAASNAIVLGTTAAIALAGAAYLARRRDLTA